jgi:acetyl-CoA acetyltransferase
LNTTLARGKVAIAGAVDLASPSGRLDQPVRKLEVDMIRGALDDAGLSVGDVDAVISCTGMMASMELAEYLRIQPRFTDTTMTGGSSFEVHVEHAMAAIAVGLCEVAVIVYAQTPRSAGQSMEGMGGGMARFGGDMPMLEWDVPYGTGIPAASYSLAATRHMAQYSTKPEQLAAIAVATRRWAAMNPNARYRDDMTVEDVLASPYVAEPLHKLDCCLLTDGAGALVLTTAERARDLRQPPVYVLGAGTSHTHAMSISQMPDITVTAGAVSGPNAFAMAGITPADVDVLETYDSFTITVLLALEDLGFCAKGEGGAFVEDMKLAPGGALPTNTNGGGLSYTHPGMYGMFLLVEAARQLRGGMGERQVPDAKLAVAHGCGGVLSSTATVVLGTEETL